MLSIIYFVGLVMFGVAFAVHSNKPENGFMIIGAGAVIYSFVMGVFVK